MMGIASTGQVLQALALASGLEISDIHEGDQLTDLGIDSIRLMGLLDLWRQAGADIDFARAAASEDVGDLMRMIVQPPDPTT